MKKALVLNFVARELLIKKFLFAAFSSFFEVEQVTLNRHFLCFQKFENFSKRTNLQFTG